MSQLIVKWTKYNFEKPDLITENNFQTWKELAENKHQIFNVKFSYLKEFWWECLLVLFGILFLYFDYHKTSLDTAYQLIGILLVGGGFLSLLKIILSSYSFIKVYFTKRQYQNQLKKALLQNVSFESFCKDFGLIDDRYKEL